MISQVRYYNTTKSFNELIEIRRSALPYMRWGYVDANGKYVDLLDTSVELSVVDGTKDISKNERVLTITNAVIGNEIVFANGGIAWDAIPLTGYEYWWRASSTAAWVHYATNGTTVYTNGVATGSLPVMLTTTGFSSVTGMMVGLRCYSEAKTLAFYLDSYTKYRMFL
jgi:hypothetical protein